MDKDLQQLIADLNVDLANEYAAAIQYTYNASVVSGFERPALKPFFEAEITDELGHALYLAEKIKALGGTPTTKAAEVAQPTETTDLLQAALRAETDTIQRYTKRKKQAEKLASTELAIQLEDMIADETRHKEEIERLLNNSQRST